MPMTSSETESLQLPALAPLSERPSEEEKKQRQRLHVKRTYYRKLVSVLIPCRWKERRAYGNRLIKVANFVDVVRAGTDSIEWQQMLQDLRDRVHQLEDQYARMDEQRALIQSGAATTADRPAPMPATMLLYNKLSALKDELHEQNEAMRVAVSEYERFRAKARTFIAMEHAGATMTDMSGIVVNSVDHVVEIPMLRAPVSWNACHAVARCSHDEMRRYRSSREFLSTGMSVFGWRDKRICDGDLVRFSLKKVFHGTSPLSLSLRSWGVMASPSDLPSIYSASINVMIYPLQHVDEDNVLLYRVIRSPDGSQIVKTFFLVSRSQTTSGYVIVMRSMDPAYLQKQAPSPGVTEHWADYNIWTTYEPLESTDDGLLGCKFEFGGEVRSTPLMDTNMWMLEVLLITLRWESLTVGPVFSLPTGNEE